MVVMFDIDMLPTEHEIFSMFVFSHVTRITNIAIRRNINEFTMSMLITQCSLRMMNEIESCHTSKKYYDIIKVM
jgi:hypothetical protein